MGGLKLYDYAASDLHLAEHDFLAAGRYTIADMSVFAYGHVASEAGLDLSEPYTQSARPGVGSSVYG